MRETIVRLRSGASVTDANESIADTSSGSSIPPMPASSVASTRRSGGYRSGGSVHVNTSGKENPSIGSSPSGIESILSSNPIMILGSTSSER